LAYFHPLLHVLSKPDLIAYGEKENRTPDNQMS